MRTLPVALAAVVGTGLAAEEAEQNLDVLADEVVVSIGTRSQPRTTIDSAVPVDVFGPEDIDSVNSSDLVDVVKTIVPSFNVDRQPISDGASFIRPINLRGLDSHHALVLLDGKRRHRGAVLRLGAFGPHGADIGGIPAIAIEAVEVLRDGAAAQYGSDAIAGVLNFKLREDAGGFDIRARLGGYHAGDGEEGTLEANLGLPLGKGGFLNLSAHVSDTAPTSRSEPYDLPIAGSGITPLQATQSRLAVDGVTYYGPDAFSYVYSPTGQVLQILPGSDGIPGRSRHALCGQLPHHRRQPRVRLAGADLGRTIPRADHVRRQRSAAALRQHGAERLRHLLHQGSSRRLLLPPPRRQPVEAAALWPTVRSTIPAPGSILPASRRNSTAR